MEVKSIKADVPDLHSTMEDELRSLHDKMKELKTTVSNSNVGKGSNNWKVCLFRLGTLDFGLWTYSRSASFV